MSTRVTSTNSKQIEENLSKVSFIKFSWVKCTHLVHLQVVQCLEEVHKVEAICRQRQVEELEQLQD